MVNSQNKLQNSSLQNTDNNCHKMVSGSLPHPRLGPPSGSQGTNSIGALKRPTMGSGSTGGFLSRGASDGDAGVTSAAAAASKKMVRGGGGASGGSATNSAAGGGAGGAAGSKAGPASASNSNNNTGAPIISSGRGWNNASGSGNTGPVVSPLLSGPPTLASVTAGHQPAATFSSKEFPKLGGGAATNSSHTPDNSSQRYGPGPSLRPQSEYFILPVYP